MNTKVETVRRDASKLASIASVLQEEMDRFYLEDGQVEHFQSIQNIVSVLQDEIQIASGHIEDLAHDSEVVDVIKAVSRMRMK